MSDVEQRKLADRLTESELMDLERRQPLPFERERLAMPSAGQDTAALMLAALLCQQHDAMHMHMVVAKSGSTHAPGAAQYFLGEVAGLEDLIVKQRREMAQ